MLDDLNILIVEDEALIALDLAMTLEDAGADISGPCMTVENALAWAEEADLAVLDVDLRGEDVFPVADRLRLSGTPFIFHTGRQDLAVLRERYGDTVIIMEKPARSDLIVSTLAQVISEYRPTRQQAH